MTLFIQLFLFFFACSFCENASISEGLSLSELNESFKWFQIQAGNPYVRKYVHNDDIISALKLNKKQKVNVFEGIFIVQEQDPKEDLMISLNGSQLQGKKALIFIQYNLDTQGYLCGQGSTICFINKDVIQKSQKIYIIIQCQDSCEFELIVQYQISKDIIQSQKQIISMNLKEYIKKINFMINLGSTKIKGFLLKVQITNEDYENTFDMYIFQGSQFQSIEDSLQIPVPTSSFGKIVKIESSQSDGFNIIDNYTLVLRGVQNQQFMITLDFIYNNIEIDINLSNQFSYLLGQINFLLFMIQTYTLIIFCKFLFVCYTLYSQLKNLNYFEFRDKNFLNKLYREKQQVLLRASYDHINELKSTFSVDLLLHQGEGSIFIDSTPHDEIELYRFQNELYDFQTITIDKKFFAKKNSTQVQSIYIVIQANTNLSFTIQNFVSDLKQRKQLDLNEQQFVIFQPQNELRYMIYDLQFNQKNQIEIQIILQDLNLKTNKPKSLTMIVKSCENSLKIKSKCSLTQEEITNYIKYNITDSSFLPVIQSQDGFTTRSNVIKKPSEQQKQKKSKYYNYVLAVVMTQDSTKNKDFMIFSLYAKQQYVLERIQEFQEEIFSANNLKKKFYFLKIKNEFSEPQDKQVTIYVQTKYGCIDVAASLENLYANDNDVKMFFSSEADQNSNRVQQISQDSSIVYEYYIQFQLNLERDSNQVIFISVKARSDSIYKIYVYSNEVNTPVFGNLRAIGENLDYGRIYEDRLFDNSSLNTLNMFFPQNTSNIFIYYFLDYTDLNIERVKKDIKAMSHLKQRKNIKITPTVNLTDLQTGIQLKNNQLKVQEINDGLIYIETNNKKDQYYQLDILNNYSSNYNISIYYSVLYTQSNYQYLMPGFKYYLTADEKSTSQIVFFYARANTTVYLQLFSCNGTFTFKQWSQKKKSEIKQINFTEKFQNLTIEKTDYYYFQFNLDKPQKQGQIVLNFHLYYKGIYSPYDLFQVPSTQYQVLQNGTSLNIKFNYLVMKKEVVEDISEQIFKMSYPSIPNNNTTDSQQEQQYILDFENTKALKNYMNFFSAVKVTYYFQISSNQSHISYCNPCFSVQKTYKSYYIMEKRSFTSKREEINSFQIQKSDIMKSIQKNNPSSIVKISDTIKNSTISSDLYFNIMVAYEMKDNFGQVSEGYYFLYDTQKVNITYFDQTQVQRKLKEQKQIQTFHLTLIICCVVFFFLLLASIICSYRIFRKGINLPCSCFMQQVYTEIKEEDTQSKKIKVRRLSQLNNIDGQFNQKARESLQEFIHAKKKKVKSYSAPPPTIIEQ